MLSTCCVKATVQLAYYKISSLAKRQGCFFANNWQLMLTYIYIYVCVCVCVYVYIYIYIYICTHTYSNNKVVKIT